MKKAAQKQIIIFNEAHYNPRNRVFVASLLKYFKEEGYKYFAAEAFNPSIHGSLFQTVGQPTLKTGFYICEPQFGNLIREAVNQHFILYPYEDTLGGNFKEREINEARNIQSLLKKDPTAKIIIYCGFDHVYEDSVENLGKAMAGRLKEFTGIDPYTIDQYQLSEKINTHQVNPYYKLINAYDYAILVDKNKRPFNKILYNETSHVDALLYSPPTKYIYNRPGWIFENNKIPYFVKLNNLEVSYPFLLKVYRENDDFATAVPIDLIEIKSDAEFKSTAVAVFPKENFKISLTDKNGKQQFINENFIYEIIK